MKKILLIAILFAACSLSGSVTAQGIKDVRINEVLVLNEDNFEDDYGHREGWIELFNAGYSQVNLGGCYLTVYRNGEGEAYRIPKGDPRTIIPPQGYLIFYAEGTSTKGTFHTNFTLGQTGYIALFDQSGRGEPVSAIEYSLAAQIPDVSIGYMLNQDTGELEWKSLTATTPNATNEILESIPAHEKFRQLDPIGYVMALTAMSVVFCALILLYLIFRTVGKAMVRSRKRKEETNAPSAMAAVGMEGGDISGEEMAAIALALRQYQDELHDIESAILTINRVTRTYSPWSSKIYGLRQLPNKK